MPQPGMLDYWSCGKGFEVIKNNGEKLKKEDVAGKFVLTYYKPFADSWIERDTDDIVDLTNKHWYSHTKSALYDKDGNPIKSSNAEAFYNDDVHDATVYVPHDSVSYVIDYEALGLDREDIEDGLFYQNVGMNVMDPNLQQVVFRLKESNLSRDQIISLWQDKVDFSNSDNIDAIVNKMKEPEGWSEVKKLNLAKTESNKYYYNIQDYSCAIQATAPVLYATSAKIKKEGFDEAQADVLRKHVGLYNIYDEGFLSDFMDVKDNCNLTDEIMDKYNFQSKFLSAAIQPDEIAQRYMFQYELSFKDLLNRDIAEANLNNIEYTIRKNLELEIIKILIEVEENHE